MNLHHDPHPTTSSGLAQSDLKIGMLVTASANKRTGDRTLVNAIWEIAGLNKGHALLVCRKFGGGPEESDKARLVLLDEHDFYAAEALAAAAGKALPEIDQDR